MERTTVFQRLTPRDNYLFSIGMTVSSLKVEESAPDKDDIERRSQKRPPRRYRHERARLGALLYDCTARTRRHNGRGRLTGSRAETHGHADGLAELLRLRLCAKPRNL